jgi:lipopolysaccharide transport system ATP-binding protein
VTPVIIIENLSKQYRLGLVGTGTLSHDLRRWWHLVRGKDDPYLKIGEVNDRSTRGTSDYVWALKDINFEVQMGDVLGIIGKNGAGKSTLLKILSKVTAPSTGRITYFGRIGSLLEVGTGFNPELTGRENIYLNGAILGMRKLEIDRKFDEIVDFSGCERYIDTPVKRYSSGMTVRLGFAVAAFLEPEILVVDEVLAVGDAEFQKKAIGKMQDVSRNQGRTVLFVSHNMGAVARLCKTGILLKNGNIVKTGEINNVIEEYLKGDSEIAGLFIAVNDTSKPTQVLSVKILNSRNLITETFSSVEDVYLELTLKNNCREKGIRCNIGIWDIHDSLIMMDRIRIDEISEIISYTGRLNGKILLPNRYKITMSIDIPNVRVIDFPTDALFFEIVDTVGIDVAKSGDIENGLIKSSFLWNKN